MGTGNWHGNNGNRNGDEQLGMGMENWEMRVEKGMGMGSRVGMETED